MNISHLFAKGVGSEKMKGKGRWTDPCVELVRFLQAIPAAPPLEAVFFVSSIFPIKLGKLE